MVTTLFVLPAGTGYAGEWDFSASVATEMRMFPQSPRHPGQFQRFQPSLVVEPDLRWESDDRKHQVTVVPFLRVDGQDDRRTHADLRDGYYRYVSESDWSVLAGISKVFWGKTESRHLVDIVNQDDGVEDIDGEDKLGQPMVLFGLQQDWGRIDLIALPGFRERTFPGEDGRLRSAPPVSSDREIFESGAGRNHIDFAARYSHFIDEFDIGLSIFHGTSREPRMLIEPGRSELTPVYDQITQVGADIQYTDGAWLWKFEGIVREGHGDIFFASIAGFEYTFFQVAERPWDLGILLEGLYDGRDDGLVPFAGGLADAAPVTPFESDLFVGTRLTLNDIQDTSVLAGGVIDIDTGSTALSIEAERRLGQDWKFEVEGRFFLNSDPADPLFALRNDDLVTLRLTRHF